MSLDQKTLDLLTAKDNLLEAQWLDAKTIVYLQATVQRWELWQHSEEGDQPINQTVSIGSALPYSGQFVLVSDNGLLAMALDHTVHDMREGSSWDLPGPSTDLVEDFQKKMSFISFDPETGLDSIYLRTGDRNDKIWSSRTYIRHLQWHPTSARCLFLSWSRDELPWHAAELRVLGAGSGEAASIFPPGLKDYPCGEACYSPNGEYIAATFLTGDFFQLWLYKIKTENWVQLSFENREHSFPLRRSSRRSIAFLSDRSLVGLSSEKAFWQIFTLDFHGHSKIVPSPMTHLQNLRVNPSTHEILTLTSGIQFPEQITRFARKGHAWLSKADGAHVSTKLKSEPIAWATDSGEMVHGILYRDRNAKTPSPLLIPIHGGPSDAVHASWPSKALAFVQQGYVVLYVNYRGSWGYGYNYHQSLAGHWGDREIKDCVSGVRSLKDSEWIDPKRVGLWGGGTASFTVLWALIKHPEVFHAGVAVFPILDLVHHFAACSPAERTELLWALGSDDPKVWAERSPVHSLGKIQRPLALFAGRQDKLVDIAGLEKLADDLKTNKVPCWLSLYETEGRSWRSHETYIDYYSKVAGFFDRFLRFRNVDEQ